LSLPIPTGLNLKINFVPYDIASQPK
jgi:hypothetical protein